MTAGTIDSFVGLLTGRGNQVATVERLNATAGLASCEARSQDKGVSDPWLANPQSGAGEKSRTPDLRITNALLYQLSYTGFLRVLASRSSGDYVFDDVCRLLNVS